MSQRAHRTATAALAALLVAAGTGLALTLAYDPTDALASVARMLLVDRAARFARSLHFWSALAFVALVAPLLVRAGPRAVLGVVALALLAASGYALRGEHGSARWLDAASGALATIPGVGPLAATGLFGSGEGLRVVLVHHAFTLPLLALWWLSGGRRIRWPRWPAFLAIAVPVTLVALWVAPPLDDGLPTETETMPAAQRMDHAWGETWRRWLLPGWVFAAPDPAAASVSAQPLPVVLGRPEGCLVCHANVTGLSASHDPAAVGCAACHRGNVYSLQTKIAHDGMLVVPGNLADAGRTCGGDCHADVVARVRRSLMSTLAGVVTVNRLAWNEPQGDRHPHIATIGHSPADSHLRQLCAMCHLGAPKLEPAPVTELPQSGGCTACHVTYDADARAALERYRAARATAAGASSVAPPTAHPNVALPVDNAPCFGCHSRSGRISLSYEGWHEAHPPPPETQRAGTRTLEDERILVRVAPDAHATSGLACIDCHTAQEVMGDGQEHMRQSEQLRVACGDCHPHGRPRTVAASEVDGASARIMRLRKLPGASQRVLATASGDILVNAHVDADGRARLVRKRDGVALDLRSAPPQCREPAHARVSCIACHSAWAPRCATCHTRFDPAAQGYDLLDDRPVPGEWVESSETFSAVPPTLGMRRIDALGRARDMVEPFIPGMIATFDGSKAPGGAQDPIFRRWYARAFSHTVSKPGRSCVSCHNDPVALGYGEGRLDFVGERPGRGQWRFTPAHPPGPDGLPSDAWIGFLRTRTRDVSTRDDVRPLSVDEQRRMLAVGACLTCHDGASAVMQGLVRGERPLLDRLSAKCRVAVWDTSGLPR